ncbi:MAG: hypothetical protein RLZZ175_2375 [Bacteroidota bacterium]|jgi:two-component system copper resistance phosphate regulon response regulator CusR
MKILIIEDEIKTALSLKQGLEESGYEVHTVFDGEQGIQFLNTYQYDIIICDIILPKISGLEVCAQYRKKNADTPIIMLTALGSLDDKKKGYSIGVDDYLVKPFEFEELLLKIKVLLKRTTNIINEQVSNKLYFADVIVDLNKKEVYRNGDLIELSPKEFSLLVYLIENKNRVVSRVEIAEKVWGIKFDTGTNVIEVYVNYLRNKIDKNFSNKIIHNKQGMGYFLKDV